MKHTYHPQGTCSKQITFDLEQGILHNVRFYGGCHGNQQGIAHLVEGLPLEEVICRCSGIRCGSKNTSCPDQLTKALRVAVENEPKV